MEATPAHAELLNDFTEVLVTIFDNITGRDLEITYTYYSDIGTLRKNDIGTDHYWERGTVSCPMLDDNGDEVWVDDDIWRRIHPPDPTILLITARDLATDDITPSEPAINPPARAPVQLGLWLAIDDPGPITATAYIGDYVWSRTTARIVSTTFDMGNGDHITCDEVGTPIPESAINSIDPGPCGYIYTHFDDLGDRTITITTTWERAWIDSDGNTGLHAPYIDTVSIPDYQVYEIQTVGVGN